MSDSATVLLIVPRLTSRLVQSLAARLLHASPALHVLAPVDADAGVRVPHALAPHVESGILRPHYGTAASGALVRALLQENAIHTVYLVCELDADADAHEMEHASPAARARAQLQPLCALLECVRGRELTLVPVFTCNDADAQLLREDSAPIVRCASEASARFSGAHALLHAYAVSYRLNVQIALLQGALHAEGDLQRALDFVQTVARKRGEKAPIHAFKSDGQAEQQAKEEEGDTVSYAAQLLLFGAPTVVESARAALAAEYAHAQVTVARTHPGQDADEAVQAECRHASHLVYVQGADEPTLQAWEAGGAPNLLDNVRHNLYAPWLLAHIARRGAQRFWRVDTCGRRQDQEKYDEQNGEAEIPSSRYDAVCHFADRLCRMEMDAAM